MIRKRQNHTLPSLMAAALCANLWRDYLMYYWNFKLLLNMLSKVQFCISVVLR